MKTNKTFVIAPLGLSEHEVRVLKTICLLSRNRPRSYELGNTGATRSVDFAIVDQDDPQAMAEWERFQISYPLVPAVMLGKCPAKDPSAHQLARPIMATRLLKLLDQMKVSSERPAFTAPEGVAPNQMASGVRHTEARWASANARWNRRTALVVDDSLPIRRQIELELAPLVGQVDLAEDGEQALARVVDNTYDIIFLDVVLPGVDGYKICRQIKRDKRTKQTPVIMLTGKSSPFDRVKGKLAGCDTYLTKPVDHATFGKVVQEYLHPQERASVNVSDMLVQSIPVRA